MVIEPNTNIRLVKVPLILDNKNQLTFDNKDSQFNYFNRLPHKTLTNATYQRRDNIIRYPDVLDNIINYNYVMYQNSEYDDKWFYAFITNMRYVNNGMTEISIATDVWQTWCFDINFKKSFVEREMLNTNDDIPGANLVPEGLEMGEVKVGGTAEFDELEPINVVAYSGDKLPILPIGSVVLDLKQWGYIVNRSCLKCCIFNM